MGTAAIKEVTFSHEVGIGQGDPFPPEPFSFCAAIVIYLLPHLQARLGLHLYVDDFLVTFASKVTLSQAEQVFHELRKFSAMSGLQLKWVSLPMSLKVSWQTQYYASWRSQDSRMRSVSATWVSK